MGAHAEVDETTVREMIKSGRSSREHDLTLTIEIAVMSLGIKREINPALSVGFKRDTLRLLRQIIAQMLERREETWNLVRTKMDSAPKGNPPDDKNCAGEDAFWCFHQGMRISDYMEEPFGMAHPYAIQSNMADRFDVLYTVLKRLNSEFPEDQRRVATEYCLRYLRTRRELYFKKSKMVFRNEPRKSGGRARLDPGCDGTARISEGDLGTILSLAHLERSTRADEALFEFTDLLGMVFEKHLKLPFDLGSPAGGTLVQRRPAEAQAQGHEPPGPFGVCACLLHHSGTYAGRGPHCEDVGAEREVSGTAIIRKPRDAG